ncbi:hypothetical protein NBRC116494_10120 [Aurantivibrio plasticivorans]
MFQRILFVVLFMSSAVFAEDRSAEIDAFVALYQDGDLLSQKRAIEPLAWRGITDERVYDEIEKKLLENYQAAEEKLARDAVSWYIKGLGYSGNAKYITTLDTVRYETTDFKHRKYAKSAIKMISQYAEYNRIINDQSQWNSEESGDVNRFANMVRSHDLELKRLGVRRVITDDVKSDYLLEVINADVLANYQTEDKSKLFANTYAYMTKALAALGDGKYADTVRRVAEGGYSIRLRKYAKGYLDDYKL